MANKKQKLRAASPKDSVEPQSMVLSTLPLELLAEILTRTSPKDMLSLARCSRYFCDILVKNPDATFIWRGARKSCCPPVPDPTSNFTEPAYAAYIFDGGPCEQCGKYSNEFYKSFSLRLRICNNQKCYKNWKLEKAFYPDTSSAHIAVSQWFPSSEGPCEPYYRKAQFQLAVNDYAQVVDRTNGQLLYSAIHQADEIRKKKTIELSRKLITWRNERMKYAESVYEWNSARTRALAHKEGWEVQDLKDRPSCSALLMNKRRALERVTELDFKLIKPNLEAEIIKMIEKRTRSTEEQAYAKRRGLVVQEYHRLRSTSSSESPIIVPTLSAFRELPIMKSLQNKHGMDPDDMAKKLKDPTLRSLLDDNLSSWRDKARNDFSAILGFRKYHPTSEKKLHPVDRLTSRFLCSKCMHQSSNRNQTSPLDFEAACVHNCSHLTKKQKSKRDWSAAQFVLDHKAIKVTRDLFTLLKISEEDRSSQSDCLHLTGNRIRCTSCDGTIVMNFEAMQRHSHRHEDMQVEVIPVSQLQEIKFHDIEWGLCYALMSLAKSAPRKQKLEIYGCRHCIYNEGSRKPDLEAEEGEAESYRNQAKAPKRRKEKLMSFQGMRGHVFQCHGVSHIADEDFYRVEDKDNTKAENKSSEAKALMLRFL
ncbi:hypothetical protein M0805_000357 [Coniferiporia weirii]|nr:hypothetical protein M0805_000357 [Coniferiporia weirii]